MFGRWLAGGCLVFVMWRAVLQFENASTSKVQAERPGDGSRS